MSKERVCGIYKIVNKLDGKIYVGQSIDIHRRMNELHHKCRYLHHAIVKHGKQNFESFVLEFCDEKELDEKEVYWIKKLHSHVSEGGYNISWGGNATMKGIKHTEESKKKISDAVKGENHPLFGTHLSDETKRKISENMPDMSGEKHQGWGKKMSDEARRNMSKVQSGENHPNFGRRDIKRKTSSSPYYGVRFRSRKRNNIIYEFWEVSTRIDGKIVWIGQHKDEIEAAKMYNDFIIKNNLNYPLNKID